MITVKFEDVGGDKKSWTATMSRLSDQTLIMAIHKAQALVSRDIECDMISDTEGRIYAGMRIVGRFTALPEVDEEQQATTTC